MIVVRGKQLLPMDATAFQALAAQHQGVTIDLGAGDGKWVYRLALREPRRLVVAIEPVAENVREASAKASKRPEKGGAPNALFIQASVEALPPELTCVADVLHITLPWGSLMRGIILGDEAVLRGIASLLRDGGTARIVLNTRIFEEPVPLEARDLPEATPDHMRALAAAYARCGLRMIDARTLEADEVGSLGTTWAKRLSHRAPPPSLYVELLRAPDA